MFGENKSVVESSNIPHGKLPKSHNALSYHRVREAIASKILAFTFIPGTINPADILSKHWGYSQIWDILKPILFLGRRHSRSHLRLHIRSGISASSSRKWGVSIFINCLCQNRALLRAILPYQMSFMTTILFDVFSP